MLHQGRRSLRFVVVALVCVAVVGSTPAASQVALTPDWLPKLDPFLQQRASLLTGRSRVIGRAGSDGSLPLVRALVTQLGGVVGRSLPIIAAVSADLPNVSLPLLAANPLVARVSLDRRIAGAMERTSATIGATAAR